jgi:hypothetical protein
VTDKGIEDYLGKPTKASRRRVELILSKTSECSARLTRFDLEHPDFDFFDFPIPEISEDIADIQRLIDEFVQTPILEIAYHDERAVLYVDYALGARRPLGEQLAVRGIIGLIQTRRLALLRQCECKTWFFARKIDQKACSPTCRHRAYEQTEAFKANRRLYMRKYYALKQSGKVK